MSFSCVFSLSNALKINEDKFGFKSKALKSQKNFQEQNDNNKENKFI